MPLHSRNRGQGKYTLSLLKRAQDAHRHHNLNFTFYAMPTEDLRDAISALTRLGLLGHTKGRRRDRRRARLVTCTLRYFEGEPLIGVATTPLVPCSYHDLKRRAELGRGMGLLLWSDGQLKTGVECLNERVGGLLIATLGA